jgi:tetratricopeptide (TPR) repeat protein
VDGDSASLEGCVHSLSGAVDEIVVVRADEHGGDRASARNDALARATGSWVLAVDATHTLDPASVDLVRDLVDEDRFVGYHAVERHQFGMDGAVSSIQAHTVALFPRHETLRWVGPVYEQVLARDPSSAFRLVRSRLVLHQHDARPERYDPAAAARRHLPVLQLAVRVDQDEPFHLYNLGRALEALGLHGEAESTLRAAIEVAGPATWAPAAYVSLSRAVAGQGRRNEAVKLCEAATELAPDWADGWCRLGDALVDAGRPRPALAAYERALRTGGPEAATADTAWLARAGMGKVHHALEEYDRAAECLRGAVDRNPTDVELRLWLARAYDAAGRLADAQRHLDVAAAVPRVGPAPSLAFADFFTKRAEAALLRGLADNPENRALLDRIERMRAAGLAT